jgi:hypothetical protein
LSQVSIAWVYVKIPRFGALIAQRRWKELDRLFSTSFWQSLRIIVAGAAAIVVIIWYLQGHYPIGKRFLDYPQVAIMLGSVIVNHFIGAVAVYLRAHKQDPFVWLSLVGAVLTSLSIWIFGRYFSSMGMIVSSLTLNLFYGAPTAYWLWSSLRRKWHIENAEVQVPGSLQE